MSFKESLYLNLPRILQDQIISYEGKKIYKRRYGGNYKSIAEEVKQRDKIDYSIIKEWQKNKLISFLNTAKKTVYWNNLFMKYDINPSKINPFDELNKLPIINKEIVKKEFYNLVNNNIKRNKILWRHTSGSTGSGLKFPETIDTERYTWAFWWRYRNCHNINFDTKCGYFGGRSIINARKTLPPFWKYNKVANQLIMSAYHLSKENIHHYLEALENFNPEWLHGYPSILTYFSRLILEFNIEFNLKNLRIITTGAENLNPYQKKLISECFRVPVVEHYGLAEAVANISTCEYGELHIDEDFSYVEIIPTNEKNIYKLIGTNWLNEAFPLLRYDTGDLIKLKDTNCSCGRASRIISHIDGREEDYIYLPNGVKVGRMDHIFKDMINIYEAQLIQSSEEDLDIFIVKRKNYNEKDEKKLIKEFRKRLGEKITLNFHYVSKITRGPNGKLRLVISKINSKLKH